MQSGTNGKRKGRLLVVGAGYGGLAAAIELVRKGFEVEVFESAKGLTKQGDSIQLSSYATRIMSKWGHVLEKSVAVSSTLPDMTFFDAKGNKILVAPLPCEFGGYPILYCKRGEIQKLMYDYATSLGIKFNFGCRILRYFEEDSCVGIYIDDRRIEADAVIAADGIHSTARQLVTGKQEWPRPSGFAIYRSWFSLDLLADDPLTRHYATSERDEFHVWLGKDVHAIVLTNVALRGIVCFCTHKDSYELRESWNFPGNLPDLLKVVDGWDETIRAVCSHIPPESIIDWKLLWRDPIKKWVSDKGRLVLVGDAAHPHLPTSGSGGGQAFEDAATIGALLDVVGIDETPLAFRAFERLRYERTSLTQRLGWETRHRWHQTDWNEVKKNPEVIRMPQPEWLYGADAEKYAYDNAEAVIKSLKEGTPFKSANVPDGHIHEDWTVDSLLELEKQQAREHLYRIGGK